LDYVAAWFVKSAEYLNVSGEAAGIVSTNSICQGEQVGMLWPIILQSGIRIRFAHTSFPWANNAARNAGVTCVIVGLSKAAGGAMLFDDGIRRDVANISPYLVPTHSIVVTKQSKPLSTIGVMQSGNKATDDGNLILTTDERAMLLQSYPAASRFTKRYIGSRELINGGDRWCLWIEDERLPEAMKILAIKERVEKVRVFRQRSRGKQANDNANTPHRFVFAPHKDSKAIVVSNVSSERRSFLPCTLSDYSTVASNLASVIYDAPLWNMALIASRLHLIWIATVCGKLKTDFRYSNTLGWNTFPVPTLTEKNKADLTRCAEDILLAREHYFPASIADMYDPDRMDEEFPLVREAHERNDETLERIYIGRRFKNDTERLEKLFDLYTKMTAAEDVA